MSDPIAFDLEEALSAQDEPTPQPKAEELTPPAKVEDPTDARIEAMREALRISESARMDLLNRAGGNSAPQPQQTVKWFSRDELREMLNSEDPEVRMQAVEISQNQGIAAAAQHFEARLGPLANSAHESAKDAARRKYPLEFELFGDQIEQFANQLPDKNPLSTVQGWDHLVRFVKGDDKNTEKLVEARMAARAREREALNVPGGFTPTRPNAGNSFVIDDTTRAVAQNMIDAGIYKNIDEYVRDMKGFTNYLSTNG